MKSILIAEDNKRLCEKLCKLSKNEGFHCECAATVDIALKKLKSRRFELLVCDLRLPTARNEGIILIKKARKLEEKGEIDTVGVIVITGYAEKENAIQALKLGAFDYLEKEFTSKTFKDSVKRYFIDRESKKRYFAEKVEEDHVVKALEEWIKRHPNPDQKLFFSGEKIYSARDVFEEIKKGSELGNELKENLVKVTLDLISKAKR